MKALPYFSLYNNNIKASSIYMSPENVHVRVWLEIIVALTELSAFTSCALRPLFYAAVIAKAI